MKRPQIIVVSITGLVAAVAVGYLGVQVVGVRVMYAISGGTIQGERILIANKN